MKHQRISVRERGYGTWSAGVGHGGDKCTPYRCTLLSGPKNDAHRDTHFEKRYTLRYALLKTIRTQIFKRYALLKTIRTHDTHFENDTHYDTHFWNRYALRYALLKTIHTTIRTFENDTHFEKRYTARHVRIYKFLWKSPEQQNKSGDLMRMRGFCNLSAPTDVAFILRLNHHMEL